MRIWKRLLGLALCLCAAVCVMSVSASAANHTDHPICGKTHKDIGDHTGTCEDVTWTAWNGVSEITYNDSNTAYVYLSGETTLTDTLEVKNGHKLYLCLNGKTLKGTNNVITVEGGAALNICDCGSGGKITNTSESDSLIKVDPDHKGTATLNLYGGKVSGSVNSDGAVHDDGAVMLYNNAHGNDESNAVIFNMYGGEVRNAGSGTGSGIFVSYSRSGSGFFWVNIYGGTVASENTYGIDSSGSSNATVLVAGGEIKGYYYAIRAIGNLKLSGSPLIHADEDEADIGIITGSAKTSNDHIIVADDFALAEGTTISVYKYIDGTESVLIAKPEAGKLLDSKAQYFVSAEKGYFVESKNGELYLTACAITKQPTADDYTVTANGSDDKVEYQWYSTIQGDVPVTNENATASNNYRYSEYSGWYTIYNASSTGPVNLEAFTLHMNKGDILTLTNARDVEGFSIAVSGGTPVDLGEPSWDSGISYRAPAEGDYTLTVEAKPTSYYDEYEKKTYYHLDASFIATVTADVLDEALTGQVDAMLNPSQLETGTYICQVTWEGKTTRNSQAVSYTAPHTHNWSNDWSHDATHHWNECQNENCPVTDNSQKNDYKEHNGGTATCQAKAVCAICGTAYGETDASNHTGTETWVTTATTHEKKWSCCGAVTVASAEHNWNTPTIAPATCTAAGNKHYTCTECGATKDEIIPASGHDWAADLTEDTPATCEHTGSKSKHCSRCAEITDVTEIPALGHDFKNGTWLSDADHHWKKCSRCDATDEASKVEHKWDNGKVTAPATCTEPGNMRYTCETCSAEKDETISAAGHDYSVPLDNAAPATCETDGKETDMKCSRCDAVEIGKTLPALGHAPVHHDAKAASCTGIGWDAYDTCSRCDYTTYKEIAALGHDFVNGSYQHDAGKHWKKCSRCDAEDAKAAHNFSQNGRTYTCTDCGYSYTVSSGGGSSTITVPVTGSRDTVKISASVSGGTAEVKEIRQDELDKIGTDSDVVIDLAGLGKSVTGAALPVGTVERISGSQADGALIKLPHAQVRLDRQTLAALAQQASGSKVQLVVETNTKAKSTMTAAQKQALDGMKNAAAIEAYFVSNGQRIYDFNGGQVELTIPYQAGGAIRGWYLKEDGTREQVSAVYDKENARLTLRHFSHYVIEELEAGSAYAACPKDGSCPIAPYTDAAPTAWYHDGVHYCIDNGLMQGVSSTQFLPDGSTTRAQLVTILWRLEGAPAARGDATFLDAADGAWYTAAVRWAAGEGIVRGYGDGRFGPDDAVTREQMVAILYRFAQYKGADVSVGGDTNILSFADAAAVSEYAVPAMQWACGSGLVAGVAQEGGLALVPKGTTTRAQAATLMMRFQSIFVKNT